MVLQRAADMNLGLPARYAALPVSEVWGIGGRSAEKLERAA
mgnify:CR=1 FL=1